MLKLTDLVHIFVKFGLDAFLMFCKWDGCNSVTVTQLNCFNSHLVTAAASKDT